MILFFSSAIHWNSINIFSSNCHWFRINHSTNVYTEHRFVDFFLKNRLICIIVSSYFSLTIFISRNKFHSLETFTLSANSVFLKKYTPYFAIKLWHSIQILNFNEHVWLVRRMLKINTIVLIGLATSSAAKLAYVCIKYWMMTRDVMWFDVMWWAWCAI